MSISKTIRKIGINTVASALGVSAGSVREQLRAKDKRIPACWFVIVRGLAREAGISVDEAQFRFRPAAHSDAKTISENAGKTQS